MGGAMFTFINVKLQRLRRKILSQITAEWKKKVVRLAEPCIIMIITATISVLLPNAFKCTQRECYSEIIPGVNDPLPFDPTEKPQCTKLAMEDYRAPRTEDTVKVYVNCPAGVSVTRGVGEEEIMINNQTYNEAATLLFVTGEQAIKHLFSNGTHGEFDIPSLITVLIIYYILACWAAGTAISSGLVVPMLFIGALYGRIVGEAMVDWFGIHPPETSEVWSWIDPGAMALIGAASFFGGVSRLTMSLTVIMVEITNDISFLLPIMFAILISKWVGDFFTHPLYHSLLEFKCIPFLDTEPVVYQDKTHLLNLELYSAEEVMTTEVTTIKSCENVGKLSQILLSTTYGGFPVQVESDEGKPYFYGLITRLELCMLLLRENLFQDSEDGHEEKEVMKYEDIHVDKLLDSKSVYNRIEKNIENEEISAKFLNLKPYINASCISIPLTFSLHRTYIIFRTLGLRHLPVVDTSNKVVGMITRKDLMGFKLERKLNSKSNRRDSSADA